MFYSLITIASLIQRSAATVTIHIFSILDTTLYYTTPVYTHQSAVTIYIGKIQLALPATAITPATAVTYLSSFNLILWHCSVPQ
jgi:hypothetical protein